MGWFVNALRGLLARADAPGRVEIRPQPAPAPATGPRDLSGMDTAARVSWLLAEVVRPTLAVLAARGIPSDRRAEIMLLAIACQESAAEHRDQINPGPVQTLGPALGLWQFERGGGVRGVLTHHRSKAHAVDLCKAAGVEPTPDAVWRALKTDDRLACAFARLLLWTDWAPMPHPDNSPGGWDMYLRCWRPGKPHPDTWSRNWRAALAAWGG